MSQNIQTFLISLGTGLIICVITFVLGLKAGKNQEDRLLLKEHYMKVHSHFLELKNALENDKPKLYQDYTKSRDISMPLISKMTHTSEILLLNDKIAKQSTSIENAYLDYTLQLYRNIRNIQVLLTEDLEIYSTGYKLEKDKYSKGNIYFLSPNSSRFYDLSYYIFYNKKAFIRKINDAYSNEISLGFSLNNPIMYKYFLNPKDLNITVDEYTNRIFKSFHSNIPEYSKLCAKREIMINQLNAHLKILKKRIKEPVKFSETVVGAITDIFK